jgi:2-polyprenyl-3-methyl-5-hydroxy-6-metoxy-1,4-benzoquinol methylase
MDSEAGAVWRDVARRTNGEDYAARYAARFDELAASGQDIHGEATFVTGMVGPGARVLDAGCGTGRVAELLHERGYAVTGVDVDETMVAVAAARSPEITWHVSDLAALDLAATFDVVVLAGNVVPFVSVEALPSAVGRLAAHLAPEGSLVCGYGLDQSHLPPGAPVVPLTAYDEACAAAGLVLERRLGGWDGSGHVDGGGYAVSVHRRASH